jgi:ribonuclease HII
MKGAAPALRRSARGAAAAAAPAAVAVAAAIDAAPPPLPPPRPKRARVAAPRRTAPAAAPAASDTSDASDAPAPGGGLSRSYEAAYWRRGFARVAGVDEAGRGPLAGPVVAAACVVPAHVTIPGVEDSKKLNAAAREAAYAALTAHPEVAWAVAEVDAETIDEINILQATMRAMEAAVAGLGAAGAGAALLVDGNRLPSAFDPASSRAIIKGDAKSFAIAAASIIAKVHRDRAMLALAARHPGYGFERHMGYGVPEHLAAIAARGPCAEHRRSFNPVREMVGWVRPAAQKVARR